MKPILLTFCLITSISHADVDVVADKLSTIPALSHDQVREIYKLKRKTLPNGETPILLECDDPQSKEDFYSLALDKTPNQARAYYARMMFTGEGRAPREVKTDALNDVMAEAPKSTVGYCSGTLINRTQSKIISTYE